MTKTAANRKRRIVRRDGARDIQVQGAFHVDLASSNHSDLDHFAPSTTHQKLWRSIAAQRLILIAMTCTCLLPFVNEAFHIDDPLFLWAAKQIVKHPYDPYGFQVVWYGTAMPMSEVTKNPPLAAYFLASVGSWAGWSEPVLHLAFLLPAMAVVIGVHFLARDMTQSRFLAALITLASPGFLISATSVMSDVPMLALWLLAVILWRRGLFQNKLSWLAASGVLIGICSLTKYFGIALIPLLFLYSLWRERGIRNWFVCFLIPIFMLGAYQLWTESLYAHGSLSGLADYVQYARSDNQSSTAGSFLVALSFTGGCVLPALLFIPWLWSRRWIALAIVFSALGTAAIVSGWIRMENSFPEEQRVLLAVQLSLHIVGGISALGLALGDFWRNRDADSVLLLAWVLGTFTFATFLNWTVNGRSILPMIPAVAILIARRLEYSPTRWKAYGVFFPVGICLALALWVTSGDAVLANSARSAALQIHERGVHDLKRILFSGHWGFQYYLDSLGGEAIDSSRTQPTMFDIVVIPRNNSNQTQIKSAARVGKVSRAISTYTTTMQPEIAAGFYTSVWGPMPYAFASVPDEEYDLYQLKGFATQEQMESLPQP